MRYGLLVSAVAFALGTVLERIPPEAGVHLMSSHFDLDLTRYDLDMPLERIETAGVQGILEAFKRSGRDLTLREAAKIYGRGIGMPHMVGTPFHWQKLMSSTVGGLSGSSLTKLHTKRSRWPSRS